MEEQEPTQPTKKTKKKKKVNNKEISKEKRIKVLFMHGFESGPTGRKVKILKELFTTKCPDMRPVIQSYSGLSSPYIQSVIALIIVCLGLVAYSIYYAVTYSSWPLYIVAAAFIVIGIVLARFIIQSGVVALIEASVELQRNAIAEFKPDIIIGSSYGGGIAVNALMKSIWSGPTILLAPAHAVTTRWARINREYILPERTHVVIVHGYADNVVPMSDSEKLIATATPGYGHLISVEDDHRLNNYLTKDVLRKLVVDLLKNSKLGSEQV